MQLAVVLLHKLEAEARYSSGQKVIQFVQQGTIVAPRSCRTVRFMSRPSIGVIGIMEAC